MSSAVTLKVKTDKNLDLNLDNIFDELQKSSSINAQIFYIDYPSEYEIKDDTNVPSILVIRNGLKSIFDIDFDSDDNNSDKKNTKIKTKINNVKNLLKSKLNDFFNDYLNIDNIDDLNITTTKYKLCDYPINFDNKNDKTIFGISLLTKTTKPISIRYQWYQSESDDNNDFNNESNNKFQRKIGKYYTIPLYNGDVYIVNNNTYNMSLESTIGYYSTSNINKRNMTVPMGKIRVGRIVRFKKPSYPGYENVEIMMRSSKFWTLSPFSLKDDEGRIFENIYQFSKVYPRVPANKEFYSRWDKRVIWQWYKAEFFDSDDNFDPEYLNDEYWKWRDAGMHNEYAVRYPVSSNKKCGNVKCKNTVLYTLTDDGNVYNYVESRKNFYIAEYCKLVREQKLFKEIQAKLKDGKNILLIEIDGPHQESLEYYMDKYGVDENFIVNSTMLATERNLNIMINDTKYPAGHGYACALALLGLY